jgi:RNA polymerase sigma-70 factor (ECF subfamily)
MPGNKISEKIILFKLRVNKDPEEFAKLYDIYARRIYSFVFFKVSNKEEAEDITSEVFLKAWRYISEKKTIESFSGLLYKLARNSIVDLYRLKTGRKEVSSLQENEDGDIIDSIENKELWSANLEDKIGEKIEIENIIAALKKLKQEYREVITLRYVDELDISEISEITGKGGVAIRVTLHRGLKKLKDLLEKK